MSGIEKFYAKERKITISLRKRLVSSRKISLGNSSYIRKVRLSINFMTEWLISIFSVEFFFTYIAYKIRWGSPLCFRIFGTSETFMLRRGGSRKFPVFFFGITVLTNCVGNPFILPENFGYRNFLCMRTENDVLQSNFFVPQYAKISREPLLSFRIFGISKTFMHIAVFLQFFFVSQYRKISSGTI